MGSDNSTDSIYMLVAGVLGQVGCLLTVTIGVSLVAGLLLDQVLDTRPLFTSLLIIVSIPLNLYLIYRYARYKAESLQATTSQKEDIIRGE